MDALLFLYGDEAPQTKEQQEIVALRAELAQVRQDAMKKPGTQPDRFDRLVVRTFGITGIGDTKAVAPLLRREHQSVLRLVQQQQRWGQSATPGLTTDPTGAWISRLALLVALEKRAR